MDEKKVKIEKFKHRAEFICFFAGIIVILIVASKILKPENTNTYDIVALKQTKELFDLEPENTLDVVFVGDSECYATYCPFIFYRDEGFTSYVAGVSAQRLCDTYDMVEHVFEKQQPKVIVLETNALFRYAGIVSDTDSKYLSLAQKIFPILQFHSRWKTYFIARLNRQNNFEDQAFQKGFRYRTAIKPYNGGEYMIPTDAVHNFSNQVDKYLELIKECCEENGAKLVLVSSPSAICWDYEKHNAVAEYCSENNLDYLDMNLIDKSELDIDWQVDTKDGGNHLNYTGATKASEYFGKWIDDLCELPDHRDDEAYESWTKDSNTFFDSIAN